MRTTDASLFPLGANSLIQKPQSKENYYIFIGLVEGAGVEPF